MVEEEVKPEDEALLSFLDYILLAAIGGVCFWWFYLRDSDSDKIPEVFISTSIFYYFIFKFLV